MNIPEDLKYTSDHEWARIDGDIMTVGISDYAQGELGDVVYVELPEVGTEVTRGESFGTIEAVKAVADLFSPAGGSIVEVNEALQDAPETVNKSPYEDGWMVKIKLSDTSELDKLMDAEAYKNQIG